MGSLHVLLTCVGYSKSGGCLSEGPKRVREVSKWEAYVCLISIVLESSVVR